MDYSHSQWIMFFFCYSVLGWIWEVCYEGVKQQFFLLIAVFLHGPYLPILRHRCNYHFCRSRCPTMSTNYRFLFWECCQLQFLEFLTGFLLDRFFHLRLWDYRNCFANVGGYICAECSIVWGCLLYF